MFFMTSSDSQPLQRSNIRCPLLLALGTPLAYDRASYISASSVTIAASPRCHHLPLGVIAMRDLHIAFFAAFFQAGCQCGVPLSQRAPRDIRLGLQCRCVSIELCHLGGELLRPVRRWQLSRGHRSPVSQWWPGHMQVQARTCLMLRGTQRDSGCHRRSGGIRPLSGLGERPRKKI